MNSTNLDSRMGTPGRLAELRAAFKARSSHSNAKSWRDMRFANFRTVHGLAQGFDGEGRAREAVWYGPADTLRKETFADEVSDAPRSVTEHRGWYCDEHGDSKARGIVAQLPHGRYLAGYYMTDSEQCTWFHGIHDTARDAAMLADEHARVIAEQEREHNERWQAARDLETAIEDATKRLRECVALRHNACMAYVREEARDLAQTIRKAREELATDYADCL